LSKTPDERKTGCSHKGTKGSSQRRRRVGKPKTSWGQRERAGSAGKNGHKTN